jgi:hypothetical protein
MLCSSGEPNTEVEMVTPGVGIVAERCTEEAFHPVGERRR